MSSIDVIKFLWRVIFTDCFAVTAIMLSTIPITYWLIMAIDWAAKSRFGRWLDEHIS